MAFPPTVVYTLPDVVLSRVVDGVVSQIAQGMLCVTACGEEQCWVQVASTTLKLDENSPCLKATKGVFLFPNDSKDPPGCFLCIQMPLAASDDELIQFEKVLGQYTQLAESEAITMPERIADGIIHGSKMLASGIGWVASRGVKDITKVGEMFREKVKPNENPTEVSDKTKSSLQQMGVVTAAGATVMKGVAEGVATAAAGAAKGLVEVFKSTKYGEAAKRDENGRWKAAKTVGVAGVKGVVEVWNAMEDAVKQVVTASTHETAECIEHRYGDDAGEAARAAGNSVNNVYDMSRAMKAMQRKALATTVVKAGAKHGALGNNDSGPTHAPIPAAALPSTS